ncbi:hypothetical protein ElyMa_001703700 [Elysia marginata]|uniref:Reverse transcriptase domain-containing protein n=1 Tax=Elysia marginata TaxID=1093978 RepID=A0AAV4JWB2_9GAST|nr:hypothetical protein ElyMa_001703700 [Elysia marginata]
MVLHHYPTTLPRCLLQGNPCWKADKSVYSTNFCPKGLLYFFHNLHYIGFMDNETVYCGPKYMHPICVDKLNAVSPIWFTLQILLFFCLGQQWPLVKQVEDLDFADDISLLSHKQQDAQEKLSRVAEKGEKTRQLKH